MTERIGRALINHLKKANRQLGAHTSDFPRRNAFRLVIFVNEDHEIYDPHTVAYILWHAIRRKDGDRLLYGNVDGILFLTQRHATVQNGKVTYPVVTIEGADCYLNPWKSNILELVAQRWGQFNGHERRESASIDEFVTVEHIPKEMRRYEQWQADYRRRPYLRNLTKDQLRDAFDENSVLSLLCFVKDPPVRLAVEQHQDVIRRFGDLTQEMGHRAIPITEFPYELVRHIAAARRLNLPSDVISWLEMLDRERRDVAEDVTD